MPAAAQSRITFLQVHTCAPSPVHVLEAAEIMSSSNERLKEENMSTELQAPLNVVVAHRATYAHTGQGMKYDLPTYYVQVVLTLRYSPLIFDCVHGACPLIQIGNTLRRRKVDNVLARLSLQH
jgi:hypothetical protein